MRPPESSLSLSPSFSHPSMHLTLTDQQTDHCSLGISPYSSHNSGLWSNCLRYQLRNTASVWLPFYFPCLLVIDWSDGLSPHLAQWNIQTRRWFKINEMTIILLGWYTIPSCDMVGHVEEHHPSSLGFSMIFLVVFNKIPWIQYKSVMVIE